MVPLESLVERISRDSGLERVKVEKLIEEKQDELSGLVSKEGAAYIVGRELGISLIKEGRQEFKIKNIIPDLSSVDLTAKVLGISDIRSFEKNGKAGSVQNMQIGDETGQTRLVLWGEDSKKIEGIKEGDVVKILQAYSKKSYNGGVEISLGKRGMVEKVDKKIEVAENKVIENAFEVKPNRLEIKSLKENQWGEVKGCIVQVLKRSPVYSACSSCGSSLDKEGKCKSHGAENDPQKVAMFTGILDDGTGTLRIILFREFAERVYGAKSADIDASDIEGFYSGLDVLGKEFVIGGRIKKNTFSGELELVANKVEEVDAKKECERLLVEIKV